MINSKRTITLIAAVASLAIPAGASAMDNTHTGYDGGCHYTDRDGYDIPIDDGQSVIVDGKTVTCSGGTITVSSRAQQSGGTVKPGTVKAPPRATAQSASYSAR